VKTWRKGTRAAVVSGSTSDIVLARHIQAVGKSATHMTRMLVTSLMHSVDFTPELVSKSCPDVVSERLPPVQLLLLFLSALMDCCRMSGRWKCLIISISVCVSNRDECCRYLVSNLSSGEP